MLRYAPSLPRQLSALSLARPSEWLNLLLVEVQWPVVIEESAIFAEGRVEGSSPLLRKARVSEELAAIFTAV
jgi:hypothetical protein